MAISFRATRNLGLSTLLVIVLVISAFSYKHAVVFSEHVSAIVRTEEKIQKWFDLAELITLSKTRLYAYQRSRTPIISPITLLIDSAIKIVGEIELLGADERELKDLSEINTQLKFYKQALFSYGVEVKEGFNSGETAAEMERLAIASAASADALVSFSWDMVNGMHDDITHKNTIILNQARFHEKIIGFGSALAVIFTILAAFLMAQALARPLRRLVEGTQKIAEGDLDFQVKVESHDEIGQLAGAFNKMARGLKLLKGREKEFLEAEAKIAAEKKRVEEFTSLNKQLLKTKEELTKKLQALETYKEVTVGREHRMIDLKKEINALLKELGREQKFNE